MDLSANSDHCETKHKAWNLSTHAISSLPFAYARLNTARAASMGLFIRLCLWLFSFRPISQGLQWAVSGVYNLVTLGCEPVLLPIYALPVSHFLFSSLVFNTMLVFWFLPLICPAHAIVIKPNTTTSLVVPSTVVSSTLQSASQPTTAYQGNWIDHIIHRLPWYNPCMFALPSSRLALTLFEQTKQHKANTIPSQLL